MMTWYRFDNSTNITIIQGKVYNNDLSTVVKAAFKVN